jgi:hypothetical protein
VKCFNFFLVLYLNNINMVASMLIHVQGISKKTYLDWFRTVAEQIIEQINVCDLLPIKNDLTQNILAMSDMFLLTFLEYWIPKSRLDSIFVWMTKEYYRQNNYVIAATVDFYWSYIFRYWILPIVFIYLFVFKPWFVLEFLMTVV